MCPVAVKTPALEPDNVVGAARAQAWESLQRPSSESIQ